MTYKIYKKNHFIYIEPNKSIVSSYNKIGSKRFVYMMNNLKILI